MEDIGTYDFNNKLGALEIKSITLRDFFMLAR
ncbi:hypothetical protein TRIP_E280104 [uncultured Spirochaetota bacterium]|nr:hypothetical protein TRIP_E280104 [uncultured Spirochaetota bacterium]